MIYGEDRMRSKATHHDERLDLSRLKPLVPAPPLINKALIVFATPPASSIHGCSAFRRSTPRSNLGLRYNRIYTYLMPSDYQPTHAQNGCDVPIGPDLSLYVHFLIEMAACTSFSAWTAIIPDDISPQALVEAFAISEIPYIDTDPYFRLIQYCISPNRPQVGTPAHSPFVKLDCM